MRVPPSTFQSINHTESLAPNTKTVSKENFSPHISRQSQPSKVNPAAADLIFEVQELARDFKSGTLTKEDASKRFAALVMAKRHDLGSLGPKGKQVHEAVMEIAGDDPVFISALTFQLQRLS